MSGSQRSQRAARSGAIIARLSRLSDSLIRQPLFLTLAVADVRLSKLKLAGFKSFVDPTVVLTPGQLVGIVGPNGCGKSNLIDAVRWVLGESRASALRGESMQDVIFGGSTTRKPVSRASVELVFDNTDGRAAGQWSSYAEISVKRLVDRSGESEYYINGVRLRRKDVIDLFLGTGLGPRAYAIIEQGMISRVIEARPEDVRAFLEEAAGVTKYKERRRETEGRLADARDNLARVEDISAELSLQVERLSTQADLAKRYKELSSALAQRQVLLWRFKRSQAGLELEGLQAAMIELVAAVDATTTELHETDRGILLARERQQVLAEAMQVAQADFYSICAEVSRIEGEIKSLRETHARLNARSGQLVAETQHWDARESRLREEHALWEERRLAALEHLAALQAQAEDGDAKVPEAEIQWMLARERLEGLRRDLAQTEQKVRVAEAKQSASSRALEGLALRRARIETERHSLSPADDEELAILESEVAELSARQCEEELNFERRDTDISAALASLQCVQRNAETRSAELTQWRARLDALQALQSRLTGQGDVSDWLSHHGLLDETPLWRALHVEAGWELAVEAVLRERITARGPLPESVLLACLADASPTSLCLLRMHSERPADSIRFTARPLASIVGCERKEIAAHLAYWLSGVYAVDDLGAWLDAGQQLPPGVSLVTRQGQVLTADVLCLFAPDEQTHGALERQREIDALHESIARGESELLETQSILNTSEDRLNGLQMEQSASSQRIKLLQNSVHARTLAFVKAQEQRTRYDERLSQLAREIVDLANQESLEQSHLEEAMATRLAAEELSAGLLVEVSAAQQLVSEREESLRAARDVAASRLKQKQEAEFVVRESDVKLGDIARNLSLATEQQQRIADELASLSQEQGLLDDAQALAGLQTALDMRRLREEVLSQRREEQEGIQILLRSLEETRMRVEHALDPMREKMSDLRLRSQAAELSRTQAAERLGELGAELIELESATLADIKEASLSREVTRLGREVAELGPVNLAALVELEATRERKRYLDVQYEDLTGAIETLENAIRKIDRETREQLKTTFETVNGHFGALFPRLFGGGQAQLILTGDEILDAGIQIVAQPPGKKNTSIHLLSGGEKALTAIALVFAMFQLNPAPFCMLDEVDAPLDDANTERYCEMVRHMSSVTQFVFISHSKITMEMARQLIGVTMQEQGVSRVVEVDMEEALKLAQPVAA